MSINHEARGRRRVEESGFWSAEAAERIKNRKWRGYSSQIARRMLAAIEETVGMNQRKLAELASVSPQQISKIAKGGENLTLETIAKLSDILGKELITFPEYKYSTLSSSIYLPAIPTARSQPLRKSSVCTVAYRSQQPFSTPDVSNEQKEQLLKRA